MGKRRSSFVASDHSSGEEPPAKVSKKDKKGSNSSDSKNVDDEGNTFWELSNKRRIVVQKFKGNVFVNLREYYEDKKSGAMKPSTKGIMLSIEQYKTLLGSVPDINKELRKNGVAIGDEDDEADAGDENDVGDSDEAPAKSAKSAKNENNSTAKKHKGKKANIEATSDEAEDDDDGSEL
ncbi:hypothetical protein VPNG_05426 [Cytospora leucostoma]|uniref:Transcriptional coactivator p15 (PC4) C-terminal domain-containing protein n=1 Tax=Cytospora leucostoma TaxID=1230097 RepID=A0A423XBK7_9PEZI|nr:hypothetical protein VPNG_05426 [Cytospora leucostoma]